MGIAPGAGKLLAKVLFINGAVKWAVIEGNRAVLLTLEGIDGVELKFPH
jgi:hypothetical protein